MYAVPNIPQIPIIGLGFMYHEYRCYLFGRTDHEQSAHEFETIVGRLKRSHVEILGFTAERGVWLLEVKPQPENLLAAVVQQQ